MGGITQGIKTIPMIKSIDRAMGGWLRQTVSERWPWVFLVLSILIAYFGDEKGLRSVSTAVGSAQVQVSIAFLGVVLAGLAILVAFLDEDFMELLEQHPPGIDADLWPFQWTAIVATGSILSSMALILVGSPSYVLVLRIAYGLSLFFFLYLLLVMWQLVRYVAELLRLRASQIKDKKRTP